MGATRRGFDNTHHGFFRLEGSAIRRKKEINLKWEGISLEEDRSIGGRSTQKGAGSNRERRPKGGCEKREDNHVSTLKKGVFVLKGGMRSKRTKARTEDQKVFRTTGRLARMIGRKAPQRTVTARAAVFPCQRREVISATRAGRGRGGERTALSVSIAIKGIGRRERQPARKGGIRHPAALERGSLRL